MEKALVHNGVTYTYFTWAIKNAIGLSSALEDVATMLAATPCRHILPTWNGGGSGIEGKDIDGEGRWRGSFLRIGLGANGINRAIAAEAVLAVAVLAVEGGAAMRVSTKYAPLQSLLTLSTPLSLDPLSLFALFVSLSSPLSLSSPFPFYFFSLVANSHTPLSSLTPYFFLRSAWNHLWTMSVKLVSPPSSS